uniref:Uncharacterized protein n=1 Tax=Oryza glumipatula TaxID=40148 RepID=A0A0E0A9K7_9ORYZ
MVAPECQPKVQLQASFTHLSMCTADVWHCTTQIDLRIITQIDLRFIAWTKCDYRNEGLGTARSGGAGTLTGSRQVEPRGKSMGTAIDSEPTAIDLFKELHCSKTKGFSEPVKKAILAAKTTNVMKEIQVELDAKKLESAVLQEELERLKAQAQENYRHCINDDVLWWSQKLVSDSPSVMTTISSLWVVSDRKQVVIVIM